MDVLFALGLIDEGTFADPSAAAGKAEFAGLLTRALGLASDGALFDGVQENADGSLNREGMMVMVDRALEAAGKGLTGQDSLAAFSDADALSAQARSSAAKLVAAGILHGKNGKLAPQEPLTKAQAALVVYQLLGK